MIVEELVAALGVEVDQASLNRVANAFSAFGQGAFAIASAVAGAFVGVATAVYKTAESGDQLAATAEKLGITSKALQELNYTALLTDTSAESLSTGLKFLAKNASEAATKGGDAAKSFAGIQLKENGKIRDVDQLLGDIADKFVALPDAATKTRLAMDIFGRSGTELIPMLNKGKAGIAELRAEAERTGYVLSGEAIAAAQEYDDALKRLNATLIGWRNRLASPLIEKFTRLIGILTAQVMKSGGFMEKLANATGVFLDGLNWFLTNDTAIRVAVWGVVTALSTWAISALAAASATGALSVASVAAALASAIAWFAAVAPFVAMGAAIALLIDDLYAFATGGKSLLGEVIRWLDSEDLNDTAFERMLKRAGSLVFDLTDTRKWEKLGAAISNNFADTLVSGMKALRWILDQLGVLDEKGGGDQGDAMRRSIKALDFSGPTPALSDLFPGAFGDASTQPNSGGTVTTDARSNVKTFAPVIQITTQPGADAVSLANTVKQTVQEVWDQNMRETLTQTSGFTK